MLERNSSICLGLLGLYLMLQAELLRAEPFCLSGGYQQGFSCASAQQQQGDEQLALQLLLRQGAKAQALGVTIMHQVITADNRVLVYVGGFTRFDEALQVAGRLKQHPEVVGSPLLVYFTERPLMPLIRLVPEADLPAAPPEP